MQFTKKLLLRYVKIALFPQTLNNWHYILLAVIGRTQHTPRLQIINQTQGRRTDRTKNWNTTHELQEQNKEHETPDQKEHQRKPQA